MLEKVLRLSAGGTTWTRRGMPRPRVLLAALAHITPHWARVCPPLLVTVRDTSAARGLVQRCAQSFRGGRATG